MLAAFLVRRCAAFNIRRPLGPCTRAESAPVLAYELRQDLLDHVVPPVQIDRGRVGQPQVDFAEFLQPHLQQVKSGARRKRCAAQDLVRVEIGLRL